MNSKEGRRISTDNLLESLRVVIPVGGQARRLQPLTAETSKACIRLINRQLIEISMLTLAKQGIKHFIFGVKGYTNYKNMHDHFESGVGFSAKYNIKPRVHIKYQPNINDCGSADSTRVNIEYYEVDDPIFAVQGDNIFDIDLDSILAFHQNNDAFMTIGLMPVPDISGYGIADIDKTMKISRFLEKPHLKETASNLANTGLYLISPEVRQVFKERKIKDLVRKNNRLDFGYDFIPYVLETGRPVYGYVLTGAWYDVGTPERYLNAMEGILHGQLRSLQDFGGKISDSSVWVQGESPESIRRRNEILKKFRNGKIMLEGSVLIGRHCQIGDGARIVDSCIDNYTQIGKNTVIERSAVMDRVIIGDNTEIRQSVIGRHSTIQSNPVRVTRILNTSVVAEDVIVEDGCHFVKAHVYPHNKVPKGTFIENDSII